MITTNCEWQPACPGVSSDRVSYGFRHAGDESWALDDADGWIILDAYFFEHMMSVKLDGPVKTFELVDKTCLYEMNRP